VRLAVYLWVAVLSATAACMNGRHWAQRWNF